VGQVLFPAYSRIQDDLDALRRAFFRTLHYVSLLSVPLGVAIITFAQPFVLTIYGQMWAPSIVPLELLGIYGLVRSVAVNMGSVFKAGGKPHWLTSIAVGRLAVMGILLYPAARYYGIVGVSVLSAIVSIVDFAVSVFLTNRIVRGRAVDYVAAMWIPVTFSAVSAVVARLAYARISVGHGLIGLLMAGALMVFLYGAAVLVVDGEVRRQLSSAVSALERAGKEWMSETG
jgi:O-antigen/teichoic acid export membrane protein